MEYILNSYNHKVSDNCLRFNFKKPIRFNNQKISLMEIKYYNYFENVTDNFTMAVMHNNKTIIIYFKNGSYTVSDLNQIIIDNIQENFNITEQPIRVISDINRFAILIIVEENWKLQLDKNFMNLFGFSNNIITEGYNRK